MIDRAKNSDLKNDLTKSKDDFQKPELDLTIYNDKSKLTTLITPKQQLLGAKNILPYLNRSDIQYMQNEESKIKKIQKVFLDQQQLRSKSPKRTVAPNQVDLQSPQNTTNNPINLNADSSQIQQIKETINPITDNRSRTFTNQMSSHRQKSNSNLYKSTLRERFKEYDTINQQKQNTTHASLSVPRQMPNQIGDKLQNNLVNQSMTQLQQLKKISQKSKAKIINQTTQQNNSQQQQNSVIKERVPFTKEGLKVEYERLTNNLESQLMNDKNYKMFYWAPDYSFCGFATQEQVKQTAKKWMKDKRLNLGERQITERDRSREYLTSNVSHIPEIMKYIKNTKLDQ
eukprot:403343872